MKNQEQKKKRSKVRCNNCEEEFSVTAASLPQFCCFCSEPLPIEEKKEKTMFDEDMDEAEKYGEDPWDEYGEDYDYDEDEEED